MSPAASSAPQSGGIGPRSTPSGQLSPGPTVLRMMLGAQLRRLREAAGVSREDAGSAIRGSHAKISRLELGRVGFKERDVVDLLALYGVVQAADREPLLELARRANQPGWWHQYGDLLPAWFETYVGLEQAARQIRTYEPQFVPGLLQTEEMARAVTQLGHAGMSADELRRRVALRTGRQQMLASGSAPTVWAVVDEAALRRCPGGPEVMLGQVEHLLAMAAHPHVVIQVVPFDRGGHAGAGGPFSILRFADEAEVPDIVYLEQLTSALYLDKRADVDHYLATMDLLCLQALQPDETIAFLTDLARSLRDGDGAPS